MSRSLLRSVWRTVTELRQAMAFRGSADYWETRYRQGGRSGAGSYGRLAEWKAETINAFVRERAVHSVVEHGVGDGNQLGLAVYPKYIGLDVSATAVRKCREKFSGDVSKAFLVLDEYGGELGDLALSVDVIFHLVEDSVFEAYMRRLFCSADRYVIVYSSNFDSRSGARHVRHRQFSRWVEARATGWLLTRHLPNKYPYDEGDPENTSFCDFFFFEKAANQPGQVLVGEGAESAAQRSESGGLGTSIGRTIAGRQALQDASCGARRGAT